MPTLASAHDSTVMKLHLGCGKRYIPGFLHVDLADFPHITYRHDIRTLPMFSDSSVSLIYACHVIEYLDRLEIVPVLQEWLRVLLPGGQLYVAVPDFAALVDVYKRTEDLSLIHGPLYGRWPVPGSAPPTTVYHRTVYDFPSLQTVLTDCGYRSVRRYDWRETPFRDYDDYSQAYIPHLDKQHGALISLNVIAEK